MSIPPPIAASADYASIEELLRASMAKEPLVNGATKIFEFADPAFKDFIIRKKGFDDILTSTTSLTPVDYIFHGPNTGAPLFEGRDSSNGYNQKSNISILLKQPGDKINHLVNLHGAKAIAAETAKNPDAVRKLFRTVAFVGVFKKSYDSRNRDIHSPSTLDVHSENILLDLKDGSLGLIDQMNRENIKQNVHRTLNFNKARNSIEKLRNLLNAEVGGGGVSTRRIM